MDSTVRHARLKPEFAELYPPLKADIWEPAAEMGARVLLWQLQQQNSIQSTNNRIDRSCDERNICTVMSPGMI